MPTAYSRSDFDRAPSVIDRSSRGPSIYLKPSFFS